MKLVRYNTINYTPAVVLATRGWLEQNESGIGEPNASIHWEQRGIVAFEVDDKRDLYRDIPVGVITWTHQPSLSAVYVEQAYVEPIWRRRGIFKAMWKDLHEQASVLGVPYVRLGTHRDNHAAHAVYERIGGKVSAVFFEFPVDKTGT